MDDGSMKSPQVCTRCRQKRIRCDHRLPSCKHCAAAGEQCCFWDPILQKTVYCGYLHFLHQRKLGLERQIQQRSIRLDLALPPRLAPSENATLSTVTENGDVGTAISGDDDLTTRMGALYLGPGSSAEVVQRFLKAGGVWHRRKQLPLPSLKLTQSPQTCLDLLNTGVQEPHALGLNGAELSGLLSMNTQRALIEHYRAVVVPEFDFLPEDLRPTYAGHADLLETIGPNEGSANSIAVIVALTLSLAIVARDLHPALFHPFVRFRRHLEALVESDGTVEESITQQRLLCTILVAQTLCELISPRSCQVWDLLGAATSTLNELRLGYRSHGLDLDEAYLKLEGVLLKLEGSVVLHFQRPSSFLERKSQPASITQSLHEQSFVWHHVGHIAQALVNNPEMLVADAVNFIPLAYRVDLPCDHIELPSALLYTNLQPLFTTEDIIAGQPLGESTLSVFQIVARSACIVIEYVYDLNKNAKVLSLWLEADRVLRCGVIWLFYLVHQNQNGQAGSNLFPNTEGDKMAPILHVTALLSSFATRLNSASASLNAWEACTAFLWPMISSPSAVL